MEIGSFLLISSVWTFVAQKRLQSGKRPRTWIKDRESFEKKREAIINGGVDNLLVCILYVVK